MDAIYLRNLVYAYRVMDARENFIPYESETVMLDHGAFSSVREQSLASRVLP